MIYDQAHSLFLLSPAFFPELQNEHSKTDSPSIQEKTVAGLPSVQIRMSRRS
jgi:hypothetical protein